MTIMMRKKTAYKTSQHANSLPMPSLKIIMPSSSTFSARSWPMDCGLTYCRQRLACDDAVKVKNVMKKSLFMQFGLNFQHILNTHTCKCVFACIHDYGITL